MRKTLLAATAILIVTTVAGWTRCQGGGDTSGGCPAPMTNSQLEAARRLDPRPTSAITIPKLQSGRADDTIRPNSGGGDFVDSPTSMFNSLRRDKRVEDNAIGGTSTGDWPHDWWRQGHQRHWRSQRHGDLEWRRQPREFEFSIGPIGTLIDVPQDKARPRAGL